MKNSYLTEKSRHFLIPHFFLFFPQVTKSHKEKMASKIACVLGGTGETGKRVIEELRNIDTISKIIMLTRREVELTEG